MGYNRENFRRIKREYEGKNLRVKEEAEARAKALGMQIPELGRIDEALAGTGMRILAAAQRYRGQELENALAALRRENEALLADRAALLAAHGYAEDYTDPHYECELCKDTGAYNRRICRCMREKLIAAGYESSGLGLLMQTQSFDTFDPSRQRNEREFAELLSAAKAYAASVDGKEARNLLLLGGTGLGKTHLSTAIAKAVIENGHDVAYETAVNLFADYESERFDRRYRAEDEQALTQRYFECDLLIVDDLGTELTNQFTVSVLYNLLSTRQGRGKSTLISTNLSPDELRKRYGDRIASRLFGSYLTYLLRGEDMRMKKIMEE